MLKEEILNIIKDNKDLLERRNLLSKLKFENKISEEEWNNLPVEVKMTYIINECCIDCRRSGGEWGCPKLLKEHKIEVKKEDNDSVIPHCNEFEWD